MRVLPFNSIGALVLSVVNEEAVSRSRTSMDVVAEIKIFDEDLPSVVKRGLERLAGQGKLDEELRSICYCLGQSHD